MMNYIENEHLSEVTVLKDKIKQLEAQVKELTDKLKELEDEGIRKRCEPSQAI